MPSYQPPHPCSLIVLLSLATACSGSPPRAADEPTYLEPGTPVSGLTLSESDRAQLATLEEKLAPLQGLGAADLLAARAPSYGTELGYDPQTATNLDLIQNSALALNPQELAKLRQQGFVIAPRHAFPHMAYGYKTIYGLDLPVYISLDAILETVHLSYDALLKAVEERYLSAELKAMLTGARARLASGAVADAQVASDLDLYFGVALSLLEGDALAPVAGANESQIQQIVEAAQAAEGIITTELFGAKRELDYSQFKPRGHYEDSEALQRYFRASMWLGRTDFRLIETLPNGGQVFRRRQLEAVLALRALLEGEPRASFDRIDQVISAFVGEHDYMELREVDALLADLRGELANLSDEQVAQIIIAKGYGAQRIASQVIFKNAGEAGRQFPLDRSFALLGQRYTADSHVFSNVVYDRVLHEGIPYRYLPNPLDVAYAALGNGAALPLLRTELETYAYAPELERVRTLIDAHGEDYWGENLYNLWLSSLRAASPADELANPIAHGLPLVTGSEAWQRRLLNTQLASWAELRHDTILYVKQSYTSGIACEFPDGYVDPYPQAYERLRQYALKGAEVMALLPSGDPSGLAARARAYFDELAQVTTTLRDMAQHERTGMPFTEAQMAFLNDAVRTGTTICGGPTPYMGWYARLLFDKTDDEMEPTIADVHTDPGGNRPSKVLHVATGLPRLLVVTTDTCMGPRAYAGVASAYHEIVTGLDRLTDSAWEKMAKNAEDVPWMKPILP